MQPFNHKHKEFTNYVRTLMWYRQRLKDTDCMEPVHIGMDELKHRFFPPPFFNAREELQKLVDAGEIEISEGISAKGHKMFKYKALRPGKVNLALLNARQGRPMDEITSAMKRMLMYADLPAEAPRTPYFNTFLKFRQKHLDHFFLVDEFSGRVHTPVSNFKRDFRPNITLNGDATTSLDVATMQPLLLGKILRTEIGDNEYSRWMDEGHDIYVMLQKKAGLNDRDAAKKRFFEIMFAPPSRQLADMFGAADWIQWINDYKSRPIKENPHNEEKEYSNMAWLLQNTEVDVMRKVWRNLLNADILFLTVHDEIIVRKQDEAQAYQIFASVLNSEFTYFRLNGKGKSDESDEGDFPTKDIFCDEPDLSEYDEDARRAVSILLKHGFEIVGDDMIQTNTSTDYRD